MSNLVIVAIPSADDYVHKISSEKVPHCTILFLGETSAVKNLSQIAGFLEHTASRSLRRFGLEVDRRGTLGADDADVLFFSKSKWSGLPELQEFRHFLLQDTNIRAAYDSTPQYDEWNPHLTMGYPKTPAKQDDRDYPGFHYVSFDRIALWFGDYEGIEFPLKTYDWDMEVSMGAVETGKAAMETALEHYGVKGMRWGVRGGQGTPTAVSVKDKGKKLKAEGGANQPASKDAVSAKALGQQKKASGVKTLSNNELQAYATRLRLEQEVKRLEQNEKPAVKKFIAQLLGQTAKQQASAVVQQAATKQVAEVMKKK